MTVHPIGKELLFLIIPSIVAALLFNHFSPRGIALQGNWDTSQGTISALAKDEMAIEAVPEIGTVEEARILHAQGNTVFIDARSKALFDEGHIPRAYSMPGNEVEDRFEELLELFPLETPMVAYCSGRECRDSHTVARVLQDLGYRDVKLFIGGFPGWQSQGLPVE